jgi:UDP-N-acetylmuramate: L-alanyl-gamma-D-glutamyl-meso-diaminopimelate ligase
MIFDSNNTFWRLPKELRYHFLGIGGVAMGNTAVDLAKCGFKVSGSDVDVYSPMKELLAENGIIPQTPYSPENIKDADWVIVGNAISRGNPELEAVLNAGLPYISLPELLKWGLLIGRKNLVISGTHGKTTTTALVVFILEKCDVPTGYMIGGAPRDFPTGFSSQAGEYFVLEGDEYDIAFFDKRAKFLQYLPYGAIINNIEFDHGDIYRDLGEIQDSFRKLVKIIPENGILAVNGDDENIPPVLTGARVPIITFGLRENNRYRGFRQGDIITILKDDQEWGSTKFRLTGEFNLRNALGAVALLDALNISKDKILEGLREFRGVVRRMEFCGEFKGIVIYDDFAHHPTAVECAIQTLKEQYPGRRLWAIFQPRSNTSVTNVFQQEWIQAFSSADKVVIAELHRKNLIPEAKRLSREKIFAELALDGIETFLWNNPDEILANIPKHLRKGDIVLTMSNSDFGGLAKRLGDLLMGS